MGKKMVAVAVLLIAGYFCERGSDNAQDECQNQWIEISKRREDVPYLGGETRFLQSNNRYNMFSLAENLFEKSVG